MNFWKVLYNALIRQQFDCVHTLQHLGEKNNPCTLCWTERNVELACRLHWQAGCQLITRFNNPQIKEQSNVLIYIWQEQTSLIWWFLIFHWWLFGYLSSIRINQTLPATMMMFIFMISLNATSDVSFVILTIFLITTLEIKLNKHIQLITNKKYGSVMLLMIIHLPTFNELWFLVTFKLEFSNVLK